MIKQKSARQNSPSHSSAERLGVPQTHQTEKIDRLGSSLVRFHDQAARPVRAKKEKSSANASPARPSGSRGARLLPLRGLGPKGARKGAHSGARAGAAKGPTRLAPSSGLSHGEGGGEQREIPPRVGGGRGANSAQEASPRPTNEAQATLHKTLNQGRVAGEAVMDSPGGGLERDCQGRSPRSWSHEVRSLTARGPPQSGGHDRRRTTNTST